MSWRSWFVEYLWLYQTRFQDAFFPSFSFVSYLFLFRKYLEIWLIDMFVTFSFSTVGWVEEKWKYANCVSSMKLENFLRILCHLLSKSPALHISCFWKVVCVWLASNIYSVEMWQNYVKYRFAKNYCLGKCVHNIDKYRRPHPHIPPKNRLCQDYSQGYGIFACHSVRDAMFCIHYLRISILCK